MLGLKEADLIKCVETFGFAFIVESPEQALVINDKKMKRVVMPELIAKINNTKTTESLRAVTAF